MIVRPHETHTCSPMNKEHNNCLHQRGSKTENDTTGQTDIKGDFRS